MQSNDYPILRNCPFCGGEAVLSGKYTIQGVNAWAVYCGITPNDFFCGAQVTSIESEEEAIRNWNRRVDNGGIRRNRAETP